MAKTKHWNPGLEVTLTTATVRLSEVTVPDQRITLPSWVPARWVPAHALPEVWALHTPSQAYGYSRSTEVQLDDAM